MPEIEKTPEAAKPQDVVKSRAVSFPDLREEMDRMWAALMANPWRPFRISEQAPLLPGMDVVEKEGRLEVG
jgi:hypothetical protein